MICFKPGQRMPITLSADKDEPVKRVLYFSAPSGLEAMELAEVNDSIRREAQGKTPLSGRNAMQKVYEALQARLLGWENCGDYDPVKLAGVITFGEAQQVLGMLMTGMVSEADVKN